jgi:hypothetical protein
MRAPLVAVVLSSLLTLGCSDDDESTVSSSSTPSAAATVCEAPATGVATVTINLDDDSDGFGRFGLRTPTGLAAGAVQLVLATADDNPDPVDVAVTSDGQVVFQFVQVAAGVQCGATVDLAGGDYVVSFGDSSKTFSVVE